jgi:pyrroline-5-carboxylate reductase
MTLQPAIALVGAGAMGGALLSAWLDLAAIDAGASAVFEPAADAELEAKAAACKLRLNPDPKDVDVDVLVLAVKPQAAAAALPAYAPIAKTALVLSVMAGTGIESVARALGAPARIARAMPNLPATIGAGVSALFAGPEIGAEDRDRIAMLMAATGETVWVDTEEEIDFATAVSGSGPAYFLLLTEALAEAGAAIGLPEATAAALARATAIGSGALLAAEARAAAELRRAVASPGGTTAAALAVLDGDEKALRKLMKDAVAAAARRARQLK